MNFACSTKAREFSSRLSLREGNFAVGGRLGVFSVRDLSSEGVLYRDRLLSRGEDLLTFHFFKYGGEDKRLERYYWHIQTAVTVNSLAF